MIASALLIVVLVREPFLAIGSIASVVFIMCRHRLTELISSVFILGCTYMYGQAIALLLRWGPSGIESGERPSTVTLGLVFSACMLVVLLTIAVIKFFIISELNKHRRKKSGNGALSDSNNKPKVIHEPVDY